MQTKVNPTRIELIRQKARLKMMKNGYELLKKKRDGLMKEFIGIIREAKELKDELNKEISSALKYFIIASSEMKNKERKAAFAIPSREASLTLKKKNIMGVEVPKFNLEEKGDFLCYSLVSTSINIDFGLSIFSRNLKGLINLAEIESSAARLAQEIEKTRREVNALEYVHIPSIQKTIKDIRSKLDERERTASIVLMKSKEKIIS